MSAIIGLAIACFKGGKGAKDGGFWTYKTNKTITYDVWQLGLTNRVLQACIAIYVILYLYLFQAGWAYGERPMGSFNAWSEGGGSGAIIKAATSLDSSFVYCGNASYSYEWAPGWNYGEPPVCRKLNKNEATTKGVNDLFFTTIYIEYHYHGWSCGTGAAHAAEVAACAARSGSWSAEADGQCQCFTEQAYYPVGVEHMVVATEMSYTTSPQFGDLKGSTNAKSSAGGADAVQPLDVYVAAANGTRLPIQLSSDGAVRVPMGMYLEAAGVSLEDENNQLPPDHRYTSSQRYPRFRTAGINVELEVRFHNTQDRDGSLGARFDALFNPGGISAEIVPKANRKQWAGLGPIMHYEKFPEGTGQQTFHKVERYRQGVVFRFVGVGRVLVFDFMQLVSMLVQIMALLKISSLVVEQVAMKFLPAAVQTTLTKKKNEKVTATSELAELGMKAAIAATQYTSFDPDGNRRIDMVDLAKVFASVEGVSAMQAYRVAHLVMTTADTDFYERASASAMIGKFLRGKASTRATGIGTRDNAALSNKGLDFAEFVTCIEGDAIGFADFLQNVPEPDADKHDPEVLARIEAHFEKVRQAADEPEEAKEEDFGTELKVSLESLKA